MRKIFFLAFLVSIIPFQLSNACTNYLVTRGASADGSVMITYAADSHIRYGELYFRQGGKHAPGSMVKIYDRGTHKYLGEIPQVAETYTVIGFMNEHQVAIGETTFDGISKLHDTTGILDYGSLMFLAMERSKTAREAIAVIAQLVEEYGYYSSGESFSIADKNEAWIMEIIGKGTNMQYDRKNKSWYNANKGAVWVAIRIPDGYVSAHANQARITNFPLENGVSSISSLNLDKIHQPSVEVVYAYDVIKVARENGLFKGDDKSFSFSDVYNPISFDGARFCESRVWCMFREVADGMDAYLDYALGKNLKNRMPLYVKANRKLTPSDLMGFKRNHFNGTDYDMAVDAGAGPYSLPYRWRPLTWSVDSVKYFHERTTVTQQTAFSYVAHLRSWLPNHIGGIFWFGVDDAGSTVYVPMYAGLTQAPYPYAEGNGSIIEYSPDAAFWTFNKVANFAYLRYDLMIQDIRIVQSELEKMFADYVPVIDKAALELYETNPELSRRFVSDFSTRMADYTVDRWEALYQFLMVKYIDGNVKKSENGKLLTNKYGRYPIVTFPGYPEWWLRMIVESSGDKFRLPDTDSH
ncbi:MAG: dipeptidase [Bacteroidales bacterium]|nr:dipeptidase [Bacteroidales bacterium]